MTAIVYTRHSAIQRVLEPTIAPYGTAKPSFLYSFVLRPDNLALSKSISNTGILDEIAARMREFTRSRAASCEESAAHEICGVIER
jgi:hypothetical protein